MASPAKCSRCGDTLPAEMLSGNCAACLFADALQEPDPSEASAEAALLLPEPGDNVGPYTLVRVLGEGGASVVWLAQDPALGRPVAIKFLKVPISPAPGHRERFQREAQVTAQLASAHAITVHQIGQHAGHAFIVMEYAEGGSVEDELRTRGSFHWREAVEIIRQAAAGLEVAHRFGIVHRDIKPGNLLRGRDGLIKVGDFGLARASEVDGSITQTGTIVGTPSFIAPEQCRGGNLDERTDVYSLTCTFYSLLTGHPPFLPPGRRPGLEALLLSHLSEPFPDVRAEVPNVPAGILEILQRGTQKNPDHRYQTVLELLKDLDQLQTDESQPSAHRRVGRKFARQLRQLTVWVSRSRRRLLTATSALLVLLAAGIWGISGIRSGVGVLFPSMVGTRFTEASAEWEPADEKDLALSRQRREATLAGLGEVSAVDLFVALSPNSLQFSIPLSQHRHNLALPPRFILAGRLLALRVTQGKTWLFVIADPRQSGMFIKPHLERPIAVAFERDGIAEDFLDYAAGDAVRVVVQRRNWGYYLDALETNAPANQPSTPDPMLLANLSSFCRFTVNRDYLAFEGLGIEKRDQPLTWVDADEGRAQRLANDNQLSLEADDADDGLEGMKVDCPTCQNRIGIPNAWTEAVLRSDASPAAAALFSHVLAAADDKQAADDGDAGMAPEMPDIGEAAELVDNFSFGVLDLLLG